MHTLLACCTHAVVIEPHDRVYADSLLACARGMMPHDSVRMAGSFRDALQVVPGATTLAIVGRSLWDREPPGDLLYFLSSERIDAKVIIADPAKPRVCHELQAYRGVSLCDVAGGGSPELSTALRFQATGQRYFSPSIRSALDADRALQRAQWLDEPLRSVLCLAGVGLSDKEIAFSLKIPLGTVFSRRSAIERILSLHGPAKLKAFALRHGYVGANPDGTFSHGLLWLLSEEARRNAGDAFHRPAKAGRKSRPGKAA